jgi:hypothetical protein
MLGVCESLSMVVQNYTVLVGGLAIILTNTLLFWMQIDFILEFLLFETKKKLR